MKKTTRYKFEPSWREATYKSGKYHTDIEERVREYIETGDTDEEYLQFSFFYPAWKVIKAEIDKRKARNARARELRRLRRERQLAARAEQVKQPTASQPETATPNEVEAPHEATHTEKPQTYTPQTAAVTANTTSNRAAETASLSAQKTVASGSHVPALDGTRPQKSPSPSMPRWLREANLRRAQKKKRRRLYPRHCRRRGFLPR